MAEKAVEDAGAELFLTPQSEVEEARHVQGLTVQGVERLQLHDHHLHRRWV